ncbi:hypothetical protein [Ruegeria sp.]|uniref:hypothetical protein n=1 Tax=Ruegeria sp. TaxID=1879320 RepID=UPI003B5CD6DE
MGQTLLILFGHLGFGNPTGNKRPQVVGVDFDGDHTKVTADASSGGDEIHTVNCNLYVKKGPVAVISPEAVYETEFAEIDEIGLKVGMIAKLAHIVSPERLGAQLAQNLCLQVLVERGLHALSFGWVASPKVSAAGPVIEWPVPPLADMTSRHPVNRQQRPTTVLSAAEPAPAQRRLSRRARAGAFLRAATRAVRRLDDHWIGDLIGAVAIFIMLWVGLLAGWVLS